MAALSTVVMLLGGVVPASAGSVTIKHLQAVSGGATSSGCEGEDSESWDSIAVNPIDPDNIIVAWNEGNGGNCSVDAAWSADGGVTWSTPLAVVPFGSVPADPYVTFGRNDDGEAIAYLSAAAYAYGDGQVVVATSIDGGRTWSEPVVADNTSGTEEDPAVVAHPTIGCRAYVPLAASSPPERIITSGWIGGPYLSVTEDCGRAWDVRPILLDDPGSQWLGGRLVVMPPGVPDGSDDTTLLFVGPRFTFPEGLLEQQPALWLGMTLWEQPASVIVMRSTDEGRTWSEPVELGNTTRTYTTPLPDDEVDVTHIQPTLAVDPSGTVHVAWSDHESPGSILLTSSEDSGLTWNAPEAIVTSNSAILTPTMAVSPEGIIGVTYYDFRNDEPSTDGDASDEPMTTDVWFAHLDTGSDMWEETHLAGPFDRRLLPDLPAWQYHGLVPLPDGFAASFMLAEPSYDVYFARIEVE